MRVVRKALTFDDVLLVPAHSLVVPGDVSLKTHLTGTIGLNLPLLSAAMDTVTEARLAIAIAQEGGLGIVHKNMPPKAQAAEVAKVKSAYDRAVAAADGAAADGAEPESPAAAEPEPGPGHQLDVRFRRSP